MALAVTRQGSHGPGRACMNASGSSTDSFAIPGRVPATIRASYVDRVRSLDVLPLFPALGSAGRRFASLPRVLRGEFPCFHGTFQELHRYRSGRNQAPYSQPSLAIREGFSPSAHPRRPALVRQPFADGGRSRSPPARYRPRAIPAPRSFFLGLSYAGSVFSAAASSFNSKPNSRALRCKLFN